jgi:hypothetical protein
MHKALIFIAGTVAGAIALPVTLVYVKPVRNKISKIIAQRIVNTLVADPEAREFAIDLTTNMASAVILLDEAKKVR